MLLSKNFISYLHPIILHLVIVLLWCHCGAWCHSGAGVGVTPELVLLRCHSGAGVTPVLVLLRCHSGAGVTPVLVLLRCHSGAGGDKK